MKPTILQSFTKKYSSQSSI